MTQRHRLEAQTSAFTFPQDLLDEGVDQVLDRLQVSGVDGVTVATTYHHGRDLVPHNPRRSLLYHEGGVTYFAPAVPFDGPLQASPSVLIPDRPIERLLEAADRRNMRVTAWVVFLHNSRLGASSPESTVLNALGDSIRHALCPANPAVRRFAVNLATATARVGVSALAMESLAYLPATHGDHHERAAISLGALNSFLLDLCFCSHCKGACRERGIDVERIRQSVETIVRSAFASGVSVEGAVDQDQIAAMCDGEMGGMLDVRRSVVTSLTGEVAGAVAGVEPTIAPVFLDPSGATLGYETGRPTRQALAVDVGWQFGIDAAEVAAGTGHLGILAYAASAARVTADVQAYQQRVPAATSLTVVLRPMAPDTSSARNLRSKLDRLIQAGVAEVGLYHYGLMPLRSLGWIREALA